MPTAVPPTRSNPPGNAGEVFVAFLRLGLTAFGGPIAHIGYLREAFVRRRGWLDDAHFAQLLAVCQFLPGPASSQMGFGIGLARAGWRGALAAFAGFTLPSALLMFGFAAVAPQLGPGAGAAALHGLKLVAVAVVAHGLLGMARQLAPDLPRLLIAAVAAALVLTTGNAWMQLAAIALGALLGPWWCRQAAAPTTALFPFGGGRRIAAVCLTLLLLGLLAALLLPASATPTLAGVAAAFYRAGALVFGGGHVVLPLLQQSLVAPGWLPADSFLAGYGAAQAVPGPMFSLAAFLGAEIPLGLPPAVGALVALLAMFLPGFLLLAGMLPLWAGLVRHRRAASAMAGINAAVVGLLAAALIDPVWSGGVRAPVDAAIAVVGFALLAGLRWPAWTAVLWCVGAAVGIDALA
ncbi:chromate efflux transporter [Thermomonas fusca]|uniref:Chromate efflux transporter n=1 Tax=Thermomonas fusca TaxID=215690 RepID=A0A5R9PGH5_9GAMM|nr:chromate efflux transporter [Thermomonas fusca]TLX22644.1 chromate efflux transporter [Thermomonas fusca]